MPVPESAGKRVESLMVSMELEFVPVEAFYFALTLAVRLLEDIPDPVLLTQVHHQLKRRYGQASTVAPGEQNTFNYVFRVYGYDNPPSAQLLVSIADWQDTLRLSSDYGWTLNADRKPVRTEKFCDRKNFAAHLKRHLESHLQISFPEPTVSESRPDGLLLP